MFKIKLLVTTIELEVDFLVKGFILDKNVIMAPFEVFVSLVVIFTNVILLS